MTVFLYLHSDLEEDKVTFGRQKIETQFKNNGFLVPFK